MRTNQRQVALPVELERTLVHRELGLQESVERFGRENEFQHRLQRPQHTRAPGPVPGLQVVQLVNQVLLRLGAISWWHRAPALFLLFAVFVSSASCSTPMQTPGPIVGFGDEQTLASGEEVGFTGEALTTVEDVEQLVQSYGNCVSVRVPGIGFAIRFDSRTGWVGESHIEALSEASLNEADRAQQQCGEDLQFGSKLHRFDFENDAPAEAIEAILKDVFACVESEDPVSTVFASEWVDRVVDEASFVAAIERIDPASSPAFHWCVESAQGEWYVFGNDAIWAYLRALTP